MSVKNGVWVLTTQYNEYDQHGDYLLAIWPSKPTLKQLAEYFEYSDSNQPANVFAAVSFLEHVLNGGGRKDTEYQWYNLEFKQFEK